jgi:hypothetical protein
VEAAPRKESQRGVVYYNQVGSEALLIRANRKDANHWSLVAEFHSLGVSFQDTSRVGGGCPDGFAGFRGQHHAIEFKMPKKGRVLHSQRMWAASTKGCWHEIRTVDDVHKAVKDWTMDEYYTCEGK